MPSLFSASVRKLPISSNCFQVFGGARSYLYFALNAFFRSARAKMSLR